MPSSGPLVQRKDLSALLLPSSFSEDDKRSLPEPVDDLTASALAALSCKFRREEFRRLPKKDGQRNGSSSSSSEHSPHSPNYAMGTQSDDGSSLDADVDSRDDDTDDVASETSSSGTDSSGDERKDDAEMDAAISLAANLLKEEQKGGVLRAADGSFPTASDSESGAGTAAAALADLTPVPAREAPPSVCCGPPREDGTAADVCPKSGVMSVCGRRREMEDAVAMVPAFAIVPCDSAVGCKGNGGGGEGREDVGMMEGDGEGGGGGGGGGGGNSLCQVHLFSVFDGHGGSQVRQTDSLSVAFCGPVL